MIIGMLIFPDMTQLDFTGPHEVFAMMPGCQIKVIARSLEPVAAHSGLRIVPDTTLDDAPALDVLFVPGGPGTQKAIDDEETLAFVHRQGQTARYVTSVCTGALVLGAAGLLEGYRATTHWLSLDLLPIFGAEPSAERVAIDRNRITGGGVTAGIDFGLTLAKLHCGEDTAKRIQLILEYRPAPPFDCGHPSTAEPAIVESLRARMAPQQAARLEQANKSALRYCGR